RAVVGGEGPAAVAADEFPRAGGGRRSRGRALGECGAGGDQHRVVADGVDEIVVEGRQHRQVIAQAGVGGGEGDGRGGRNADGFEGGPVAVDADAGDVGGEVEDVL